MRRAACLLVLAVAARSWADSYQTATTHYVHPSYGAVRQGLASNVANELDCYTAPAFFTVEGATGLTVGITQAIGGSTLGLAIYPNSDSGTALFNANGSGATAGKIRMTGTAFTIEQGTLYRWCTCATSASLLLAAASTDDNGSELGCSAFDMLNAAGPIRAGKGTACTAGVPPSTTGALGAIPGTKSRWYAPTVAVEK